MTGYNYIIEENTTKGLKLNFAQKEKKEIDKLSFTKFNFIGGAAIIDIRENEKKNFEWYIINNGNSSKGIDIVISGECIEKKLLIQESVYINFNNLQFEEQKEYNATFIETIATSGEKIFYDRIEDFLFQREFN